LNLGPIFGRIVHLPISNNGCNYGFVSCHKKKDFPFYLFSGGPEWVICWEVATPISHIGVIEGRPDPRLHVFSRCVGIHRIISKTWPLKYKLQKGVPKNTPNFFEKNT
jgi:hypothetical protein